MHCGFQVHSERNMRKFDQGQNGELWGEIGAGIGNLGKRLVGW